MVMACHALVLVLFAVLSSVIVCRAERQGQQQLDSEATCPVCDGQSGEAYGISENQRVSQSVAQQLSQMEASDSVQQPVDNASLFPSAAWLGIKAPEAADIIAIVPSMVMDDDMKAAMRELTVFADKVLKQKMSKEAFAHANVNPLLLNVGLLRLYAIQHAELQKVVVRTTEKETEEGDVLEPGGCGDCGDCGDCGVVGNRVFPAEVAGVTETEKFERQEGALAEEFDLRTENVSSGELEMADGAELSHATESALKHYVLIDVAEKVLLEGDFLAHVMRQLRHSSEVYFTGTKEQVLAGRLPSVPLEDIILSEYTGARNLYPDKNSTGDGSNTLMKIPRHMVFFDHLTKHIVVAIRGTATFSDVIIDLYMETTHFLSPELGLFSHRGLKESAEAMLLPVTRAIRAGHSIRKGKYKDYEVVVTGHSMGAGVASLLALLLSIKSHIPSTTFAFAPPATLSVHDLSPGSTLHQLSSKAPVKIYSFVNNDDVIARCSYRELMHMLGALAATDCMNWSQIKRSAVLLRGRLTDEEMLQMQRALMPVMADERRQKRHSPQHELLRSEWRKLRDLSQIIEPRCKNLVEIGESGKNVSAEHHAETFHEVSRN